MSNEENGAISADSEQNRIMVCDDSKIVRLTAKKMLGAEFDLVLAEDGEDAWSKLTADSAIKVLFTDLTMPNLNGFGLIERVRTCDDERIRNIPVVVITGATEDEAVKRKIFDVGATDFITKPFKATDLIARANSYVDYLSANQELQKSSNLDVITGALNRKGITDQIDKDTSFTHRHAENLSVAILRLDDFDELYSALGQRNAETVLKQVVKIVDAELRKEDSIGRYTQSKLLISLPMAKSHGVINLAKRLCEKIGAVKLKVGEKRIALSACIGISAVNKGELSDVNNLIECAFDALRNAQAMGAGHVQFLRVEESELDEEEGQESNISIDSILEELAQGKTDYVIDKMPSVLKTLEPLVALMNTEHREALLSLPMSE